VPSRTIDTSGRASHQITIACRWGNPEGRTPLLDPRQIPGLWAGTPKILTPTEVDTFDRLAELSDPLSSRRPTGRSRDIETLPWATQCAAHIQISCFRTSAVGSVRSIPPDLSLASGFWTLRLVMASGRSSSRSRVRAWYLWRSSPSPRERMRIHHLPWEAHVWSAYRLQERLPEAQF